MTPWGCSLDIKNILTSETANQKDIGLEQILELPTGSAGAFGSGLWEVWVVPGRAGLGTWKSGGQHFFTCSCRFTHRAPAGLLARPERSLKITDSSRVSVCTDRFIQTIHRPSSKTHWSDYLLS